MAEQEPARLRYAREFYELLDSRAQAETLDGAKQVRVFRGKLTEMFKQLKASATYYSPVRAILTQTGSVTIVEAGSRNKDSILVLNFPPPDAEKISALGLTGSRSAAKMVVEVDSRVRALEAWRESQGGINIAEALRNMEARITKLEQK